ncbi:acyltransferase [Paraflavitalea speifideaquila]|uniref:acyltransferase family protein n=1 Tax=Paraflavitalea speifideaquila TaxID=3076558 RepID=UPI0028F167C1|nr:acyltransferase [Paraflavitalea speifideiaquila]
MAIGKLGFIKELDTFRFIAVVLVIVSHWVPDSVMNKLPNGFMGVTFFFGLSGFLISHNLLVVRKQIDEEHKSTPRKALINFYLRRTLRIFPLYYLVIILLYVANKNIFDGNTIWFVTYSSNILFFIKQSWQGMLSHFWSLAVEEQFYLVWPIVILFVPIRYMLRLFIITIASSITYKLIMAAFCPTLFYPDLLPIGAFDSFGLGAILAYKYVYKRTFRILDTRNLLWALPLL